LSTRDRLAKTSWEIRNNLPLDPTEFRITVNTAIEDGLGLTPEITEAMNELEPLKLLFRNKLEKIDGLGWTAPTPYRELLQGSPPPRAADVEALIAETMGKMRV
jgi:hypothetical protein